MRHRGVTGQGFTILSRLLLGFVLLPLCIRVGWTAETANGSWVDPVSIFSRNGVLEAVLEAAPRKIPVGPVTLDATLYNGLYPGPLLRVRPGDLMRLTLVNRLNEPTNLHFHGIQTSPLGNSDNVHVSVPAGGSFLYEVRIPQDQPPGLYWYHAHLHGNAMHQVTNGLTGSLIVEGIEEALRLPSKIAERVFTLKDVQYDDVEDPVINDELHDLLQTINGSTFVTTAMHPGETQLWRFSNQSANLYFHLTVRGHRFEIVAEDGVVLREPRIVDTLHIGPATRVVALIRGSDPGDYEIVSEKVLTGDAKVRVLGRLQIAGPAVTANANRTPSWTLDDLRARPVTGRRTVAFSQDNASETYRINGRLYEHGRIDTRVPLGSMEEWTLFNNTDDMHVFHIHQLSFQVTAINGKPQPFDGYLDVVRIPERGHVTILLPFTRPETLGRFVYHCHVLKHEDKGMMAGIEVFDPRVNASGLVPLDRSIRWLKQRIYAFRSGFSPEFCGL